MPLLCSDLFNLQILKDLKLVSGHGGVHHPIHWVYKIDRIEASERVFNRIQPGDLVISCSFENTGTEEMNKFIAESCKRGAAGLIVCFSKYVESLTYEVREVSDKLKFPVFELYVDGNLEAKLVKELCKAIILDEMTEVPEQGILESILNNENLDHDFVAERFRHVGMNINSSNQLGIIKFEGFEDYIKEKYEKEDNWMKKISGELNSILKNIFVLFCPPRSLMTAVKNDSVIFLTGAFEDKDEIEDLLFKLDRDIREKMPGIKLNFGLGGAYSGISGVRKGYREAKQMLILKQIEGYQGLSTTIRHMDVYLLLMGLKDRRSMEKYLKKVLDKLLVYDELKQAELIDTLDAYLNENASTIEASDKLFIHKNTLKYRLKRIESLLDVNLHSLEDCLRLLLAVKLYKLFKLSADDKAEDSFE